MRNRLAADVRNWSACDVKTFVDIVEREAGARIQPVGTYESRIAEFFRTAEMRDVLVDAVTSTVRAMVACSDPEKADAWVHHCRRAFAEEGMSYRVDQRGEVHYVVDVGFQETADSVVAALSRAPHIAAGACINKAVDEITKAAPHGKHAIRDVFEGVETAFKVTTGTNSDLTERNIASILS